MLWIYLLVNVLPKVILVYPFVTGDHIGYDRHDYEYDIHTPAKSDMSSGQNSSNRLSVVGRVVSRMHEGGGSP